MTLETLLRLNATVTLAMALAMLPVVWSRRDAGSAGYWIWGCIVIGWSWVAQSWATVLPLDPGAILADGLRILAITLLAQAARPPRRKPFNPLWPIGLLLAGYLASTWIPTIWTGRDLFVAIIVAWIACRSGFPLLHVLPAAARPLGAGFLLYGLWEVNVAFYRIVAGHPAGLEPRVEFVIAMLDLLAISFLTVAYLVARMAASPQASIPKTRDAVTGCLDRAAIDRRLQHEFARHDPLGEPLTVLIIDLDHLKAINDTHGHPAGDQALRAVAEVLSQGLRTTDALGRYGGDEFLAILPGTTADEARTVVERFRAALARREWEDDPVTVSVGAAERHPDDSPETLVARADLALYSAKHQGRDRATILGNRARREGERGRRGDGETGRSSDEGPPVS